MSQPLSAGRVITGGIAALVLTLGLGRFVYTPLLPVMAAQAGLGVAQAGTLAAANYLGYICGALLAAWIDAPAWRHRLYSGGLWLAVLSCALMAWAHEPWGWAVARFLGGLSGAAGMLLGSGLVLGWLMRAGHRPELGLYFTGVGASVLISALGAMAFKPLLWSEQWLAFAALGLLIIIPAWAWRPPAPPLVVVGAAPPQPQRWLRLMMAMYFCAGWGFVINATFTVAIVEKQPLLAGKGPWAWALVGVAAVPAVFLWDRVARRLGDLRTLLLAFALHTVGVLLPALSGQLWAALAGALLYGATFTGIVSMTLALVGRRSPANPGKAMARLTLSYGVAQVVAPALSGHMVALSGSYAGALWLTGSVLGVGMGLLGLMLRDERQRT